MRNDGDGLAKVLPGAASGMPIATRYEPVQGHSQIGYPDPKTAEQGDISSLPVEWLKLCDLPLPNLFRGPVYGCLVDLCL